MWLAAALFRAGRLGVSAGIAAESKTGQAEGEAWHLEQQHRIRIAGRRHDECKDLHQYVDADQGLDRAESLTGWFCESAAGPCRDSLSCGHSTAHGEPFRERARFASALPGPSARL